MNKLYIDTTARIADGASIGDQVWVGAHCEIGAQVEIRGGVILGQRVRMVGEVYIGNSVQIADEVTLVGPLLIEEDCRIGAGARIGTGLVAKTNVRKYCSIGRGAVIESGVELKEHVFVKARSHVFANVPAHGLVSGDPAALVDYLCGCGGNLASSELNGLVSVFRCRRCAGRVPISKSDIDKRGHQLLPNGVLGQIVSTRAWWLCWNENQDL